MASMFTILSKIDIFAFSEIQNVTSKQRWLNELANATYLRNIRNNNFSELCLRVSRDVARILTLGGLKPMESAEREPITGVWGQSPPEAERVLAVGRPVKAANFPHSMHF